MRQLTVEHLILALLYILYVYIGTGGGTTSTVRYAMNCIVADLATWFIFYSSLQNYFTFEIHFLSIGHR